MAGRIDGDDPAPLCQMRGDGLEPARGARQVGHEQQRPGAGLAPLADHERCALHLDEAARAHLLRCRRRRRQPVGAGRQQVACGGHALRVRQPMDLRVGGQVGQPVQVREQNVALGRHVVGGHARGRRGCGAVVAERRLVGDAVAVPRQQQVRRDPVQDRGPGHVDGEPRRGPLAVPGEEGQLIADAGPEPGDMAAVPGGAERRQVARHQLVHFFGREGGAAVEHDAAHTFGIEVRELDGDGGPGVAAEEGHTLQAEGRPLPPRARRRSRRICGRCSGEGIGAAVARRVRRDDGEARGQRLDHGNKSGRRARRFVKQHDRRAAAGAAHHDHPPAARDEAMLDHAGPAPCSRSTRFSTLPPGLRGSASMKSTSLGTLKPARFSLP